MGPLLSLSVRRCRDCVLLSLCPSLVDSTVCPLHCSERGGDVQSGIFVVVCPFEQDPKLPAPEPWTSVTNILSTYNNSERKRVMEALSAPSEQRRKRKKSKRKCKRSKRSKTVGVDGGREQQQVAKDCIISGMVNMELPLFDASKMRLNLDEASSPKTKSPSKPMVSAPTALLDMAALKKIQLNLSDPIPLKKETKVQSKMASSSNGKLDFASFPQGLGVSGTTATANATETAAATSTVPSTTFVLSRRFSVFPLFPCIYMSYQNSR